MMYRTVDAYSYYAVIYFITLVIIGAYFVLNLFLAVLKIKFAKAQTLFRNQLELQRKGRRNTLLNFMSRVHSRWTDYSNKRSRVSPHVRALLSCCLPPVLQWVRRCQAPVQAAEPPPPHSRLLICPLARTQASALNSRLSAAMSSRGGSQLDRESPRNSQTNGGQRGPDANSREGSQGRAGLRAGAEEGGSGKARKSTDDLATEARRSDSLRRAVAQEPEHDGDGEELLKRVGTFPRWDAQPSRPALSRHGSRTLVRPHSVTFREGREAPRDGDGDAGQSVPGRARSISRQPSRLGPSASQNSAPEPATAKGQGRPVEASSPAEAADPEPAGGEAGPRGAASLSHAGSPPPSISGARRGPGPVAEAVRFSSAQKPDASAHGDDDGEDGEARASAARADASGSPSPIPRPTAEGPRVPLGTPLKSAVRRNSQGQALVGAGPRGGSAAQQPDSASPPGAAPQADDELPAAPLGGPQTGSGPPRRSSAAGVAPGAEGVGAAPVELGELAVSVMSPAEFDEFVADEPYWRRHNLRLQFRTRIFVNHTLFNQASRRRGAGSGGHCLVRGTRLASCLHHALCRAPRCHRLRSLGTRGLPT
jgi:hypothetical protein